MTWTVDEDRKGASRKHGETGSYMQHEYGSLLEGNLTDDDWEDLVDQLEDGHRLREARKDIEAQIAMLEKSTKVAELIGEESPMAKNALGTLRGVLDALDQPRPGVGLGPSRQLVKKNLERSNFA